MSFRLCYPMRKAQIQIHCHQHAVLDPQSEENVLRALQLKHDILKSGCCGMAGSFGFEHACDVRHVLQRFAPETPVAGCNDNVDLWPQGLDVVTELAERPSVRPGH